ncbi:MAG: FHA domain-containing protein [Phycisphaerales bacterium]|nr:MAG: FHA domain-containing protein [Phycisphaerales bacterium]
MMELHICNQQGMLLRAYALGDSTEVIIGRDDSCDIRIQARSVSREHCAIETDGDNLVLRDLGSTGGTFMGDKRIDTVKVENGMEVKIGPAVLKFIDSEI